MGKSVITKAAWRLHFLCFFFGIGASVWGYNIGILASILIHPGWVKVQGNPDAVRKGIVTAIYYLGTWTSYVFISHPLSDWLGRRYAALSGIAITCIGTALQAGCTGSSAYAMMIAGRIISGAGTAIISTSVPLYQSEIAPAKQRGRFVTMNHIGFVAGTAAGLWVGYGMTFWTTSRGIYYGWRISLLVQMIPSLAFAVGLPFLPETPRWLVERGFMDRASKSLHYLREGAFTPEQVETELASIQKDIDAFRASGLTWLALITEKPLFARLWRAAVLQFMAQMCGATAMKYYLPTLFSALGLPTRLGLMAGAIEMTLKIGCTVIEMLIIDHVGRRLTLLIGCGVMAFGMLINGTLPLVYPNNLNHASDIACVVFIFIYAFGYSLGFGPASWVYGSEIFPTSLRARGLNFAASGGAIGSIVVAQVWPVGIDQIGCRIYFFFMAVNLICIPVIYLFYPETKGLALEDMSDLFGSLVSRTDAEREAEQSHDEEVQTPGKGVGQTDQSRLV